jgi:hypothetical protein
MQSTKRSETAISVRSYVLPCPVGDEFNLGRRARPTYPWRMASPPDVATIHPSTLRAYLARHDTSHRAGGWKRMRREVLTRLPGGRGGGETERDDRDAGSGPARERTGPAPTV